MKIIRFLILSIKDFVKILIRIEYKKDKFYNSKSTNNNSQIKGNKFKM